MDLATASTYLTDFVTTNGPIALGILAAMLGAVFIIHITKNYLGKVYSKLVK